MKQKQYCNKFNKCFKNSQAPLSMGFPRQAYWSGLSFPSPGDLPNSGIEPRSPALQADSLSMSYEESTCPYPQKKIFKIFNFAKNFKYHVSQTSQSLDELRWTKSKSFLCAIVIFFSRLLIPFVHMLGLFLVKFPQFWPVKLWENQRQTFFNYRRI